MARNALNEAIMNSLGENKEEKEKNVERKENAIEKLIIEKTLNSLFYAPKKMEEELDFVKQMFTRGAGSDERVGLHASAIIVGENDFCYRQQVLSLLYKQTQGSEVPQQLKRIFEEGNAIHEKWQRLFIRGGLGKPEDMDRTRRIKKYELSFTPDAIITIAGKKYVVEIKSMNPIAFKHATSHPSGEKQCQLYMHFTGIPRGFVLAECKGTQQFKVFLLEYDHKVVRPFLSRLQEVKAMKNNMLKRKEIPVRKCKNCDTKRAQSCSMKDACFNVGIGRIRLEANDED